jgi:hypothetical protein
MPTKPLAKSLHTITVLLRVAELYQQNDAKLSAAAAMTKALTTLGYLHAEDPYQLAATALKQLEARNAAK